MNNNNPLLEFSIPKSVKSELFKSGAGALIGAGAGALGRGIINKLKGRDFTDHMGTYALAGAGLGGAAGSPFIRSKAKDAWGYTKKQAKEVMDYPKAIINTLRPGKRGKHFRKYIWRDTNTEFMQRLPKMLFGAGIGAAKQYLFTSKERLLADLNNAYEECQDEETKQKIALEIQKVENTPESALKLKAVAKGALWGSLISMAYLYASSYTRNALARQKHISSIMPIRDKSGRLIRSGEGRLAHSQVFGEIGRRIDPFRDARGERVKELVASGMEKSQALKQAAEEIPTYMSSEEFRRLAAMNGAYGYYNR